MTTTVRSSMIRISMATLLLALAGMVNGAAAQPAAPAATAKPAHRVVACYFHRTVRCPTCMKIGASIDAALKTGLAPELQQGRLEWTMLDFQDPRNQADTNAFRITGPTLVVMEVQNGQVVNWKPLPKVWSLVGDRDAFFRYVQREVRAFLAASEGSAKSVTAK
jgi:hypothetical protein